MLSGQVDSSLQERIQTEVVPRIPTEPWYDVERSLPLRYDTDIWTIASIAFPHCTGEPRTDAVYVLECLPTSEYQHSAIRTLGKYKPQWGDELRRARRILYVGVTAGLLKRLDHHLNNTDNRGAEFTQVFPPVRLLDVAWYSSYGYAERAEVLTAEALRERFPDDYVAQPG